MKGQSPSIPEQTVNRASENSKAGSHLSPRVNDTNDQTINQSAEAHLTAKENGLISPNSATQKNVAQDLSSNKSDGGSRKFLSLNQMNVKKEGRKERILIVRDESHMVWLKELKQTKKQMIDFTLTMMNNIDDHSSKTNANLKDLIVHENMLS